MSARQMQKVWESLRLEWLLCLLSLKNKRWRVSEGFTQVEIYKLQVNV